jgi:hypothetical protein
MKSLVPMWWRLGSIPELAPFPQKDRRRLWNAAWKAAEKPYTLWIYAICGFTGLVMGIWGEALDRTVASAFSVHELMARALWTAPMFVIVFLGLGFFIQGKALFQLRQMLSTESLKSNEFDKV